MSKSLTEIAQQLKGANKKVQLIYAFNGTGKTRLSREFKRLIASEADGSNDADQSASSRIKILYYNAFTNEYRVASEDVLSQYRKNVGQ